MKTLTKKLYTTSVTAQGGGRDGTVKSEDGKFEQHLVTPKELGGRGGEGTNPEQLFAAGYSGCFQSALLHVARLQKITVNKVEVTADVTIGSVDGGGFGLEVDLKVNLFDLSRDVASRLVETAHQVCPYSNATRGNIAVNLRLV